MKTAMTPATAQPIPRSHPATNGIVSSSRKPRRGFANSVSHRPTFAAHGIARPIITRVADCIPTSHQVTSTDTATPVRSCVASSLPSPDELHHARQPRVERPFPDLPLLLLRRDPLQAREFFLEAVERHHPIRVGRAAGSA